MAKLFGFEIQWDLRILFYTHSFHYITFWRKQGQIFCSIFSVASTVLWPCTTFYNRYLMLLWDRLDKVSNHWEGCLRGIFERDALPWTQKRYITIPQHDVQSKPSCLYMYYQLIRNLISLYATPYQFPSNKISFYLHPGQEEIVSWETKEPNCKSLSYTARSFCLSTYEATG